MPKPKTVEIMSQRKQAVVVEVWAEGQDAIWLLEPDTALSRRIEADDCLGIWDDLEAWPENSTPDNGEVGGCVEFAGEIRGTQFLVAPDTLRQLAEWQWDYLGLNH